MTALDDGVRTERGAGAGTPCQRRGAIDWRADRASVESGADHDQTHRRVLTVIEHRIVDGSLRPGDRLPGERDFADMLGVSRSSVREALRVLESMGVLLRGKGRGPTSGCIVSGGPGDALGSVLRLHLALSHFSLADLVDVRVQLEMESVREAARRGFVDQERSLRALIDAMGDKSLTPAQFNELDTSFHVGVSDASGNALLMSLMHALRDAVQREMVAVSEGLPDWPPVARQLRDEHEAIMDAVCDHDGAGAAELMERHIRHFYGRVLG